MHKGGCDPCVSYKGDSRRLTLWGAILEAPYHEHGLGRGLLKLRLQPVAVIDSMILALVLLKAEAETMASMQIVSWK